MTKGRWVSLCLGGVLFFAAGVISFIFLPFDFFPTRAQVQGVSTKREAVPSPTQKPTVIPTQTPSPTASASASPTSKPTAVPQQKKVVGGWYWNEATGKSEQYLGSGSTKNGTPGGQSIIGSWKAMTAETSQTEESTEDASASAEARQREQSGPSGNSGWNGQVDFN